MNHKHVKQVVFVFAGSTQPNTTCLVNGMVGLTRLDPLSCGHLIVYLLLSNFLMALYYQFDFIECVLGPK